MRDVGRGELLAVAAVAADPLDRRRVALRRRPCRWPCLEIGSKGSSLISLPATIGISSSSKVDQGADEARLRLAALAQEDDVLAGEDGVLELRDDGFFEAVDAGEQLLAACHLADQVAAHLFLDGQDLVTRSLQLTERLGFTLPRSLLAPRDGRRVILAWKDLLRD